MSRGADVSSRPGASLAAAAAAGVGGAGSDEMERAWAAYEAKIAAHKAYDAAGVDIQPVPGLVVKCLLQVTRPNANANAAAANAAGAGAGMSAAASLAAGRGAGAGSGGAEGESDLAALLRAATSVEATQTVTSAQGVEAVPAASVPADARVKLFLNLCSSKLIPAPEVQSGDGKANAVTMTAGAAGGGSGSGSGSGGDGGAEGMRLRVPLSVGALRLEADNGGRDAVAVDVVLNDRVLAEAKADPRGAAPLFIASQAVQRLQAKHNLTFLDQMSVLQNVKYKGKLPPPPQRIRRAAAAAVPLVEDVTKPQPPAAPASGSTARSGSGASASASASTNTSSSSDASRSDGVVVRSERGWRVPTFAVSCESTGGASEPLSAYAARVRGGSGIPALPAIVVVEVALPDVSGAGELDVEVVEATGEVAVSSSAAATANGSHRYRLRAYLPFAVTTAAERGHRTRFRKANRALTLWLPVTGAAPPPPAAALAADPATTDAGAAGAAADFDAADDTGGLDGPSGAAAASAPAPVRPAVPFAEAVAAVQFAASASASAPASAAAPDIAVARAPQRVGAADGGSASAGIGPAAADGVDWASVLAFRSAVPLQPCAFD